MAVHPVLVIGSGGQKVKTENCYKQIVTSARAELGHVGVNELVAHILGEIRDTVELMDRQGPAPLAPPVGSEFGDKFFGGGGCSTQILPAAKIAPITMQTFGLDQCYWTALSRLFRDGAIRKIAKPPKYNIGDKSSYYVFVGGGSKTVEACDFEYTLLRIAADAYLASRAGSGISVAGYLLAGKTYSKGRPLLYREINERLKYLAGRGFLRHEPSIKVNHAGRRRPRWYVATKELVSEMSLFDLSDEGLFSSHQIFYTDFDTDTDTDTDDDFDLDNL